jgi:hypothetical protein
MCASYVADACRNFLSSLRECDPNREAMGAAFGACADEHHEGGKKMNGTAQESVAQFIAVCSGVEPSLMMS